jgi:hypothetical protein
MSKKKITTKCLFCKKDFFRFPCRKPIFCSKDCKNKSQITQIILICATCKKEYKRNISQVKWRGSSVCSNECKKEHMSLLLSGENGPRWKGGVSDPLRRIRNSYKFKEWRKAVFKRDDYTCQDCGTTKTKLHPHHIKPFLIFPKLRLKVSNGKTLCAKCHKKADDLNRKKFKFPKVARYQKNLKINKWTWK